MLGHNSLIRLESTILETGFQCEFVCLFSFGSYLFGPFVVLCRYLIECLFQAFINSTGLETTFASSQSPSRFSFILSEYNSENISSVLKVSFRRKFQVHSIGPKRLSKGYQKGRQQAILLRINTSIYFNYTESNEVEYLF